MMLAVNPGAIPGDLRSVDGWLLWSLGATAPSGKRSKVPLRWNRDPQSPAFDPANPNNNDAWLSFDDASRLATLYPDRLHGIGLNPAAMRSSSEYALVLFDFDGITEDNALDAHIWGMCEAFDLYVEWSPSGTGMRAYAYVAKADPIIEKWSGPGHRKMHSAATGNHIGELFVSGGYCTFTGQVVRERKGSNPPVVSDLSQWVTVAHLDEHTGVSVQGVSGVAPLDTRYLTGEAAAFCAYQWDNIDRSKVVFGMLRTLARQCSSLNEFASRMWSTPCLLDYYLSKRQQSQQRAWELCAKEAVAAWSEVNAVRSMFNVEPGKEAARLLTPIGDINMDPPVWLVDEFLPDAGSTLFAGMPKSGKSMLMQSLLVSLASGDPNWMGRNVRRQGIVAYIASEGRAGALQRMRWFQRSRPDLGNLLMNQRPYKLVAEVVEAFREDLMRHQDERKVPIVAVGVDTVIGHYMGKENAADEVEQFLSCIRDRITAEHGAALVMTHHLNKEGSIRGSSNFEAFFEAVYAVEASGANHLNVVPTMMRDFDDSRVPRLTLERYVEADGTLTLQRVGVRPPQTPPVQQPIKIPGVPVEEEDLTAFRWAATERLLLERIAEGERSRTSLEQGHYSTVRGCIEQSANGDRAMVPFKLWRKGKTLSVQPILDELCRSGFLSATPSQHGGITYEMTGLRWDQWQRVMNARGFVFDGE